MTKKERMKMTADRLKAEVMKESTGTLIADVAIEALPHTARGVVTQVGVSGVAVGIAYALDCTGTTMGIAGAVTGGALLLLRTAVRAKEEWSELYARATSKREVVDGVRYEVEDKE